jgi:uncharacterized protein (DUF3820 family)
MSLSKWEIPFGKHKGKALEDIPSHYLLWLADQDNPPEQVKKYVEMHRKTLEREKWESGTEDFLTRRNYDNRQ